MADFRQYQVNDVETVEAFLNRYYRPDRYTGRGDDYAASLLASYRHEFVERGFVFISHHDSVTGRTVAFFDHVDIVSSIS